MTDDMAYWFWFAGLSDMTIRIKRLLLDRFGSPKDVFFADISLLESLPYISGKSLNSLTAMKSEKSVAEAYERYKTFGYNFVCEMSEDYPKRLKPLEDHPIGIFFRGKLPEDKHPSIAIVGARYCSAGGRSIARNFGSKLSQAGIQVISGMALGIDGAAHRGALEAGMDSFAVLGCGVDLCYPWENRDLYELMCTRGGLISEFPLGSSPRAWHFPMRNRIIAGLADKVLVVEARKKSGSLITADMALEYGRDVMAVPGRVKDALSEGCLDLIRSGARLVSSPDELLEDYAVDVRHYKKNNISLAKSEKLVYSSLCLNPKYIEDICSELHMDMSECISVLCRLENMDLIRQVYRGQYVLCI